MQRVGVVAGCADRAVAHLIAKMTSDTSEGAFHPTLASPLADGFRDLSDHGFKTHLGFAAGIPQLLDLPIVFAEAGG